MSIIFINIFCIFWLFGIFAKLIVGFLIVSSNTTSMGYMQCSGLVVRDGCDRPLCNNPVKHLFKHAPAENAACLCGISRTYRNEIRLYEMVSIDYSAITLWSIYSSMPHHEVRTCNTKLHLQYCIIMRITCIIMQKSLFFLSFLFYRCWHNHFAVS